MERLRAKIFLSLRRIESQPIEILVVFSVGLLDNLMIPMEKTSVLVAAAVIVDQGSVFLARRRYGSLAGYWEFPGGKVEPGETPEQALSREIQEELGVQSSVGEYFGESEHRSTRGGGPVKLVFYRCTLKGIPQPGAAHDALAWVAIEDLLKYTVPPADIPIVRKLMEEKNASD